MLTTLEEGTLPAPDVIAAPRSANKLDSLGKGLMSGIHKKPHKGRVEICETGMPGDSIDYPYHGGVEKALHQYCAAHYALWRQEKPDKAHLFDIGAFGENISQYNMHEENTCIGDIYQIGPDLMIQVTEPRMPCYKLNARFEWPQAARRVTRTWRIGWYFRILKLGAIQEGDLMVLTKRINPRWTVKNTARVLLDKKVDDALVAELAEIEGLGADIRGMAQGRLKNGTSENTMARTKGSAFDWNPYELTQSRMLTPRIRELTLEYRGPKDRLITDKWQSHEYVRLRFGADKPFERSYSVVTGDADKFILGIALDDNTRGGSRWLHENLADGDRIDVVKGESVDGARAPERFDKRSIARHIFVIGGIGVTAFLRTIHDLYAEGQPIEIHYACRSLAHAAYREQLPYECTTYYAKDQGKRLDIRAIIPGKDAKTGKHTAMIYGCGPNGLMDAGEALCQELEYPDYLLHFESFGAPSVGPLGEPFEAVVEDPESEGPPRTITVPAETTFLDALTDAGFDVPSSCKAGRCGICVVNVKCGKIDHKGTGLMEEAKANSMLSCVSRGRGKIEIEIE